MRRQRNLIDKTLIDSNWRPLFPKSTNDVPSPAELLNNRILRSNLIAKVSTPRFSNTNHIREELKHRQDMQKMYPDRIAHDLPPLVPDVRILDNQTGE